MHLLRSAFVMVRVVGSLVTFVAWWMAWSRLDHLHHGVPLASAAVVGALTGAGAVVDGGRLLGLHPWDGLAGAKTPVNRAAMGVGALLCTAAAFPGSDVPTSTPGVGWFATACVLLAVGAARDIAARFDPRLR